MDENETPFEALRILEEISSSYPELSELAEAMRLQIFPPAYSAGPENPVDPAILKTDKAFLARKPEEFVEAAAKVDQRKRGAAYQTPVFKCLSDYDKCQKSRQQKAICVALMVVCVGKHLIPFVRHK